MASEERPNRLRSDSAETQTLPTSALNFDQTRAHLQHFSLKILPGVALNTGLIHQMASSALQILPSSHPSLLFSPALLLIFFLPGSGRIPRARTDRCAASSRPKPTNSAVASFLRGGQWDGASRGTTAVQWGRSQRTRLWTK